MASLRNSRLQPGYSWGFSIPTCSPGPFEALYETQLRSPLLRIIRILIPMITSNMKSINSNINDNIHNIIHDIIHKNTINDFNIPKAYLAAV